MLKLLLIVLLSSSCLLLIACNAEDDSPPEDVTKTVDTTDEQEATEAGSNREQEAKKEGSSSEADMRFLEDIPEVPTDAAGFIDQKPGKYSEKNLVDKEVRDALVDDLSKLEPLTDQATEEEIEAYFKYAYSLVVKDFPDPENLVKEWEFQSFGNPDLPDSRYHFKENYNIEVILDASGSMAAVHDGKTLMETAKESILDFMAQVPEEANVSLRVYGHVGSSADSDKEASCKAIEQVYDYASYDQEAFQQEMDKVQPAAGRL
ncbi:D-amino acid dehydrogenase large subunit [Gracilibacillus boraciitolerans JCM 21714]|uniref:D-amino acid dehydrogenase large subunit n=1 Tax=Gracilibacillus boraciitolerans JCM 21714 TaxID=1298598 RepID=W4VM76_9BACI|nr:hypothetical protein [Gracilibacillus boraciitolerans]GAE94465.1 D-amino acid dehydrogenase large subunit [Gracilibacillus boraciitolerans JCM 21714]